MVPARCSLVTLGVDDVARSKAFYRSLGWETGIDMDDFAVLRTAGPLIALYPLTDMSRDTGDDVPAHRDRRIHLAINLGVAGRGRRRPSPSSWRRAPPCCARPRRRSGAATPRSSPTRTGTPGRSRTTRAGRWARTVCRSFPDLCDDARVKSFDALFAELTDKAAARPDGSGTVAALDAGVHEIGKKVVEEAAEVWMAAEHESPERAAEEISQLLYHLQVLMLARGLTLDDVYARL